jgi:hypothetical protein
LEYISPKKKQNTFFYRNPNAYTREVLFEKTKPETNTWGKLVYINFVYPEDLHIPVPPQIPIL